MLLLISSWHGQAQRAEQTAVDALEAAGIRVQRVASGSPTWGVVPAVADHAAVQAANVLRGLGYDGATEGPCRGLFQAPDLAALIYRRREPLAPKQLARSVEVIPFGAGHAVRVRLYPEWDEGYSVEREQPLERCRNIARQIRRDIVLAQWDLTRSELDAVLDEAEK